TGRFGVFDEREPAASRNFDQHVLTTVHMQFAAVRLRPLNIETRQNELASGRNGNAAGQQQAMRSGYGPRKKDGDRACSVVRPANIVLRVVVDDRDVVDGHSSRNADVVLEIVARGGV